MRAGTFHLSSMAKVGATEMAARVIDRSVQVMGRFGLVRGGKMERLYREARPMRIYEGSTEVIFDSLARQLMKKERLTGSRLLLPRVARHLARQLESERGLPVDRLLTILMIVSRIPGDFDPLMKVTPNEHTNESAGEPSGGGHRSGATRHGTGRLRW